MAFETNTLVNGEWTTRTLDVNTVLRHYDQQDRQDTANLLDVEQAPVLGLLTQTIISSPLAHWILPARLRDLERNDVAFVGVSEFLLRDTQSCLWSSRFSSISDCFFKRIFAKSGERACSQF